MEYLEQFTGTTRRHRGNHQDLLGMLYEHAAKHFGIAKNPMLLIERTTISTRPIRPLSLAQVQLALRSPDNLRDAAALDLLVGHGWRQVEVRRAPVRDVLAIADDLIEVDGKERRELTPILPTAAEKLRQLAKGFSPDDHVIAGKQADHGGQQRFGDQGMTKLVARLHARAAIAGMAGHDLRRTFGTLANSGRSGLFATNGPVSWFSSTSLLISRRRKRYGGMRYLRLHRGSGLAGRDDNDHPRRCDKFIFACSQRH
jgi:integrase